MAGDRARRGPDRRFPGPRTSLATPAVKRPYQNGFRYLDSTRSDSGPRAPRCHRLTPHASDPGEAVDVSLTRLVCAQSLGFWHTGTHWFPCHGEHQWETQAA